MKAEKTGKTRRRSWLLMFYDALLLLMVDMVFLVIGPSSFVPMTRTGTILNILLSGVCIFGARIIGGVYRQVWRYESERSYLLLMMLDFLAGVVYWVLSVLLPMPNLAFVRAVSMVSVNLLMTIGIRVVYQYMYDYQSRYSRFFNWLRPLTRVLTGEYIDADMVRPGSGSDKMDRRINIAIVGAGRVGVMLADELVSNPRSYYQPRCFIDIDKEKIGRNINGIPVLSEDEVTEATFSRLFAASSVAAGSSVHPLSINTHTARHKASLNLFFMGLKVPFRFSSLRFPAARKARGKQLRRRIFANPARFPSVFYPADRSEYCGE